MSKKYLAKPISLYSFHLPLLILAAVFVATSTTSYLISDRVVAGNVLGEKSNSGKSKSDAQSEPSTPTAKEHKKTIKNLVQTLEQVAETESIVGDPDVSDEVSDVAQSSEDAVVDTVGALEKVESRSAWKSLLVGPDYKNLGQLRSSIAQTSNEIRKLTRAMSEVNPESTASVQTQLTALTQERQRIYNVITTNESKFSLFGWLARFMAGYAPTESVETNDSSSTTSAE